MARYTMVANSKLCPGSRAAYEVYYPLVDTFVAKFVNETSPTITVPVGQGKLEGFAAEGTMRLDLQGSENGYANFQAQFGVGHGNCSKGGSYGGVLMCCGVPFTKQEFRDGLRRSFASGGSQLCQMDPDTVEEVRENIAQSKGMKTKPGKKPWSPGDTY